MHLELLSQWLADSPMPSQIKLPNHFFGYPSNLTFDQTLIAKASSFFSFLFIFPNTSQYGRQQIIEIFQSGAAGFTLSAVKQILFLLFRVFCAGSKQ